MVDEHEHDNDQEVPQAEQSRPRRRRSASRPAGPPVHAPEPEVVPASVEEPAAQEPEAGVESAGVEADEALESAETAGEAALVEGAPADDEPGEVTDQAGEGVEDAATEPDEDAEQPTVDAVAETGASQQDEAPTKAPTRRSRRATRGVTTVAFSAEPVEAEQVASAPVEAAPLALFQPPDETRAVRSRRRATRAAAAPEATVAEEALVIDEARSAETASDEDVAVTTPTDAGVDGTETGRPEDEQEGAEASGEDDDAPRRRRRRGGRRRRRTGQGGGDQDSAEESAESGEDSGETSPEAARAGATGDRADSAGEQADEGEEFASSRRRRRRRRRAGVAEEMEDLSSEDSSNTVVKVREGRRAATDEITSVRGSTRIEAKKQRRRDGRDAGRRRPPILTEAEFLARRESVNRVMCVREHGDRTQIAVLEDGVLVEHYVNRHESASMVGNVYLGKVQNVLPSMEAAFVDIGRGRNAVLYAGEVNWEAAGLEGQPKRIELALKSGDPVLVQVTKDPIGHKGARLTSQISLPGRFLVYVPEGSMTGISRKLPDTERARLKGILKDVVPEGAGVIVRTAAEGATEAQLTSDVQRLTKQWTDITKRAKTASAPALLYGEPDLAIKVVRDIFNEDFTSLVVQGDDIWATLHEYIERVAPDLVGKLQKWVEPTELYASHRIDEQLAKALDRKVWLPSGGSLVIDRTEAMTVVDVNTGKFTGQGGNLEETVTRNNLEAAEEIVRQLRLRDIGGIIVIDFIDMVLESNRDLVLRRLVECLGRDRTKHQVAEVTSLGLVQMTRKRIGQGLLEVFSTPCEACGGRGHLVSTEPVGGGDEAAEEQRGRRGGESQRGNRRSKQPAAPVHLGGKQTGKTPPPPKFDEFGHIDHSEHAEHGEHALDAEHAEHPQHAEFVEDAESIEGAESIEHGEPVEQPEPVAPIEVDATVPAEPSTDGDVLATEQPPGAPAAEAKSDASSEPEFDAASESVAEAEPEPAVALAGPSEAV